MKKVLVIVIIVLAVLGVLFGISVSRKENGSISKSKVEKAFENQINERYGTQNSFKVKSIKETKEGNGPIKGAVKGYEAKIEVGNGDTFDAFIDEECINYKDKYGEMLFDSKIENLVKGLMNNIAGISFSYRDSIYFYEEDTFAESQLEAFLRESSTYVTFDVQINTNSVDDAAYKVQEVDKILTNNSIKYMATFKYGNNKMTYSKTNGYETKTLSEIKSAFLK